MPSETLLARLSALAPPTRPRVVITGVNLVEGGTLTAFREMVRAVLAHRPQWDVVAFVHREGLLGLDGVHEIALPDIKRSWLQRLRFEWQDLQAVSDQVGADVWISMHDITPRVRTRRQFVYCHNPAPFSTLSWRQTLKDRTFASFRLLYGWLYGINIRRNTAVVVQQDWLRAEFKRRYGDIPVVVAHPTGIPAKSMPRTVAERPRTFLYPTLPRVFKNIEIIGDALARLERRSEWQGSVSVTVDGRESAYAGSLLQRYGHLRTLHFIGRQAHDQMNRVYERHDALLFPSRLETWGLPLTEARDRGMPVVAADLPYAHETIGHCDRVRFFDPTNADALADLLLALHLGTESFEPHRFPTPAAPFADGWAALCALMLDDAPPPPLPLEPTPARQVTPTERQPC